MVRNTKFCSGPTVNVQDTIFHLFVKPPFQGCPGQGRGIFEGHLWWASLKGRSHTSVVRGLVFSFQFFHNSDEKMKVIQPLKLDIDFYDVVVIFEGHPWGATLRGIFEGHLWGASLRGILEGHPWGATLRGIFEGHLWGASLKGRSHTSVVRGLVFSFQFFHNSDEKWKWSNHSSWTLTSTMSSSSS